MIRLLCTLLCLVPAPSAAALLDLPSGSQAIAVDERLLDTVRIAAGPWRAEGSPAIAAEGTVRLESFRIDETTLTTLQMLAPMKAQLEALGWQVLFSCKDRDCGGFDFRHALEVLPPPEMHVSLGDYRYLSARGPDGAYLAILVSRARQTGFLQLTHVSAGATPVPALSTRSPDVTSTDLSSLGARLEAEGRVVLSDLDFGRGSAELGAGNFPSLQALAQYLSEMPEARITLVGHTDVEGSLEGNIALSRRRAELVLDRLVDSYGVPRDRVRAEGMGYLAPLTTNLTPEGREANRRVEVILTTLD